MSRITRILCLLSVLLVPLHAQAENTPERLRMGWEEYGFQNWNAALSIFEAIADDNKAEAEQRLQARIGTAFVTQYRMPGRAPTRASDLYAKLLPDVQGNAELEALVLAQMGSCRVEQSEPDLDDARRYFRRAMAVDEMTSMPSQEAALSLVTTYLIRPDRDAFREADTLIDELAPRLEGTLFEAIIHALKAQVSLWLGDPAAAAAAYEKQLAAGIENRSFREQAMFQIGRINETVTKDAPKAAYWYERLHDESPTSGRADWSGKRAAALSAPAEGTP